MKNSLLLLAFLAFFSCNTQETDPEIARWEAQAEQVEIIRDDFGVPHIYGKTDADAVFGLLYAQCEDDFRRVERNYVWAIGRLAELEGEEAIYSDVRANLYMTEAEAKAAYEKAPDWLKTLCVAFADGINYYLHTHPEVTPQVITYYEPWMPMFFFEGSIGGDIERISTQRLKAFYEEDKALASWDAEKEMEMLREEPKGSNGIAIAPSLSESGNAMLLINPHTSFYFRPEVHVVSEEGLNAYGAVTWGQFFVYQGFNEKTGWIHTSTFVDFIDEFEEEILEEDGMLLYNYGGEKREIKTQEITLKYKDGEELKSKSFTLYRTHHGPITHKGDNGWVATKINWDPVNALIQSYTRTKLNNYAEFKEMMNIRTNSSNNTVFADAEGNIAYFHGNFIPKRNPEFDFSRPVDGSDPATDWQGLHTVDESILILNPENGWIQNCNSTPFTAAGPFSPKAENYPNYMAPDQENFRGIHAVKVLQNVQKLNLDSFLALAHDPYLPAFEYLIPELEQAFLTAGKGKENLKEAVDLLAAWDYRTGLNSVPMSLAHFYGENYQRRFRSMNRFINPSKASAPKPVEILEVLEETITKMDADFGTWKTPWGEVNRFQRLSGDIELKYDDNKPYVPVSYASGNWGALAAYGARTFEGTKRLYGYRGNSFVAVVEFGEKVRAKTILAGGQSSDPNSPHFFDQAQRYADTNFKEAAFYREDVEKRAEERYQPGKRK
ncbi:acylase [Algoriphagus taiwanensis]|uniref:Penicillin acylase family protein n=1 Tax=Algoriphagus taiwanensis TaxID=1445656 RepID=A0ABQ6PXI9_9BACT|nr:penicillin acylase family protein [Algoriphagus taiwanensis]